MDFQKVIDEINATNAFGNYLGIKIDQVSAGYAKVMVDIQPQFTNPYNTIHGGVLYTVADMAGGTAAYSYGQPVVTVDSNFHFLNAGRNVSRLIGIGKEKRNGKSLCVIDVDIMDQDDNILCSGTFTYAKIAKDKVRTDLVK